MTKWRVSSAEIARLESAVQELHASTSCRVTAPLNAGLHLVAALERVLASRRLGRDATLISRSGLFDTEYYAMQAPEVRQPGLDPHPLFDGSFYLEQNPEVAQSGENPLLHYLRAGTLRDPHPLFETAFYLEQKPHVAALGVNRSCTS
jgi:hypothetical protein